MAVSDDRKEIDDLLQQLDDGENDGGGSTYNILHDPSISSLFDEMKLNLPSVPDISDSEEDGELPHIFGMNHQEAALIDRPIIGGYHDDQQLFGIKQSPTKNNTAAADDDKNNNNNNEDVEDATNDANDEDDDDQWEMERQRVKGETINPSLTSASDAPSSSNVESTTDIDTNRLPDGPYASAELSVNVYDDIADGTNAGVMRGGFTVTFGGGDDEDDDDDDEEEKNNEAEVEKDSEERKKSLLDDDDGISFSTEDLSYDDTVDLQGNPIQTSYTSATDSPSPKQSIRSSDKPRVEIIREYLQNDSSSSSRGCSCQITPNQHLFWQDMQSPPSGIPLLSETRPSSLHSHHRLSDVSASFALSSIASSFIDLSPKQTSNAWNRLIKQPNQSLSSKEEEVDKQEGGIMEEKTSNTSLNNLSNEEMMCFMKSLTSSSYHDINDQYQSHSKDQFVSYHIRDDDQKTMNDHSYDNDDDDEQEDDDHLSDPRQAAIQARITMRSTVPAK